MAKPGIIMGGSSIYDAHQSYDSYGLRIGTVGFINGRTYVWCSSSESEALAIGEPLVASTVYEQQNLACTTVCLNVGQTAITGITAGLTAITANQFQDGLMCVVDGGGQGSSYQIKSNTAFTASTADGTIALYEPIAVASDANTEISLIPNKYANVQRSVGSTKHPFVGIPNVEVPIGSTTTQYFWAQRVGLCPAFIAGTPRRGTSVVVAKKEPGRLESVKDVIEVYNTLVGDGRSVHELDLTPVVGQMVTDAIDGEIQIVDLQNPIF